MEVVLHFDGLPKGYHTYFRNHWGADVRINPGDWVILDTEANPSWTTSWIDQGVARQADAVPDGVDFLFDRSKPARVVIRPPWGEGRPARGSFTLCSPVMDPLGILMRDGRRCTVLDLSPKDIEEIRRRWMPMELPGFVHVDARPDKRGHKPTHTLPPPFEKNFFVLVRLAWLKCRADVESKVRRDMDDWRRYQREARRLGLPEDPVRRPSRGEIRAQVEVATSKELREWGVLKPSSALDRTTLFRNMKAALETVDGIDFVILRDWKELIDSRPPAPTRAHRGAAPKGQ